MLQICLLSWKKIQEGTDWRLRDQTYVFALLTIAMLIKGPIVYAFLLPGILLFQCFAFKERRLGQPSFHVSPWPGWWPWIASLVVFLLWATGGIVFQPGFFDEVVMREFVARFGETIHRPQPLYFYLPHLLHKFAPWSVLIIGIALVDLHSRKWRLSSAFREMSPETFWLLCWSVGGLILMSLIPSKRVDRIFPIIPPLCLLLAAQIARLVACSHGSVSRSSTSDDVGLTGHRPVATENATRIYRWAAATLVLSILFTGGYTISKVISGYRYQRNALAIFGRDVRREAAVHHWRYEVVSAGDEGLLLYLQRTHFIEPDHAVSEWNGGKLDALIASREKASGLMPQLAGAALSQLKSNERKKEQGTSYVLITR